MNKPCEDCTNLTDDGMCAVPIRYPSGITGYDLPPMRRPLWDGENGCGPDGNWFVPKSQELRT